MKDMKNKRKNRIEALVLFLIFCFIFSSFIIPRAYGSEDNPYCSGEDDMIQELVEDFTEKYGEGVKIYWHEDTNWPYIVSGLEMTSTTESPKEAALSFLSENASLFGLDVDDLKFNSIQENSSMKYVDFDQFYKGVRVHGRDMRVFIRITDGAVSSVTSHYLPCLDLEVTPDLTAEEATEVVKGDLGTGNLISVKTTFSEYGIARKELSPVVPELIVYPENSGEEVYLCWSFSFSTEMPYGPTGSWYYLIDAHTGEIISNGSLLIGGGSGNNNTSINTSSASNNSSSRQSNNYSWLPGLIYNQTSYYNSPYYNNFNNSLNNTFSPVYNNSYSFPFFNPTYNNNLFPPFNHPYTPSFLTPTLNYGGFYNSFFPSFSGSWDGGATPYNNYSGGADYNFFFPGSTNSFPLGNSYSFISNPFTTLFNR